MPPGPAKPSSPRRWIIAITAILALTAFAFPAGLRDWLDERNASGWLDAPLAAARQIEAASDAIGLAPIGAALRKRFALLVGEPDH